MRTMLTACDRCRCRRRRCRRRRRQTAQSLQKPAGRTSESIILVVMHSTYLLRSENWGI